MQALVAARCEFRRRAARALGRIQDEFRSLDTGRGVQIAQVATRQLLPISTPLGGTFPHDPTDGAPLLAA